MGVLLIIFLAMGLFIAMLSPAIQKRFRWIFPLMPLAALVYILTAQTPVGSWSQGGLLPDFASFYVDGLARFFGVLIAGIGFLIFLYVSAYMKGKTYSTRLYLLLSIFMVSMLGLVTSDHMIGMFVFWEMTSISSFFLIAFETHQKEAVESAKRALLITGSGGLILLAGLLILAETSGTYYFSELILQNSEILKNDWLGLVILLILLGAMTKSAQFPFHFWLPGAMKAPTPVSAYLHSATMVKAGVYLLLRVSPVLANHHWWMPLLTSVGGITMIYGGIQSVFRNDLKSILAYSTIAALGAMFFFIGMGSHPAALWVTVVFILVHACYKAALFMIAGTLDITCGTRNIQKLSGMGSYMPGVFIAALMAVAVNLGLPPTFGFIAKDLMYEFLLDHRALLGLSIFIAAKILMMVAGLKAGIQPFIGVKPDEIALKKEVKPLHWLPALLLGLIGLLMGILPGIASQSFLSGIDQSLLIEVSQVPKLKLWHGFNIVFWLSIGSILLGLMVFFGIKRLGDIESIYLTLEKWSPEVVLTRTLSYIEDGCVTVSHRLQSGKLREYVLIVVLFLSGLLVYKVYSGFWALPDWRGLSDMSIYEVFTVFILLGSVFFTLFSTSRLVAIASLGIMGLCICLIFVFYSAPDLAMTQFTIDTLTVILFVLVLYRLPRFIPINFQIHHIRDIMVSLLFGALMGVLSFAVLSYEPNREVSAFYADNSYVLAKGKNIVNVILVDFRGADTIVEIIVLSIAAIGVFSLLKLHIQKSEKME